MHYIKVKWIHNFADEPIAIYSELAHDRNEIRKVEMYRDGSFGFASTEIEYNDCRLSKEPLPVNEEIESDPQFKLIEISQDEFLQIWNMVIKKGIYKT